MAAADYRLMTEATGLRIATALEALASSGMGLGDPVTIAHGGTGATTAAAALAALGGVAVTDIVNNLTSGSNKPINGDAFNTTKETLNWDQQSGTITLVRSGKMRQILFDDVKLPSNATSFNFSTLSANDRPYVLTATTLYVNATKTMLIWVRPSGSFGQISIDVNDIVNGALTWMIE